VDTDKSSAPAHTTTDPNTRAGDPFVAAAGTKPRGCFACYEGWVYLGVAGDVAGDVVVERVPCRRCRPETH
jgi:hypothetical protein